MNGCPYCGGEPLTAGGAYNHRRMDCPGLARTITAAPDWRDARIRDLERKILDKAAEVAQLRADGQRLTGALEKIAQGWMECAEYSRGIVPDAHLSDTAVFEQCAAELRAALAVGDAP